MITDDDLRAIEVEALVIWTTKDPSGPVDEGRRIASLIPRGRLEVIENCGHWPQYEDTATFNRFHLDFLPCWVVSARKRELRHDARPPGHQSQGNRAERNRETGAGVLLIRGRWTKELHLQ